MLNITSIFLCRNKTDVTLTTVKINIFYMTIKYVSEITKLFPSNLQKLISLLQFATISTDGHGFLFYYMYMILIKPYRKGAIQNGFNSLLFISCKICKIYKICQNTHQWIHGADKFARKKGGKYLLVFLGPVK